MPALIPAVEIAEIASKKSASKDKSGSVAQSRIVATLPATTKIAADATAVKSRQGGIVFPQKVMSSGRPRTTLATIAANALTVVVLTPPPVPDGAAPTNINATKIVRVAGPSAPTSSVLNPPVVEAAVT